MSFRETCNPHYCPFDSPACPYRCKSLCKKAKPNCISVTAQEAMNIPELKVPRNKWGIPVMGVGTRERVFGIPYDPRKDFEIPVPEEDIQRYLRSNQDSIQDRALQQHVDDRCCQAGCRCMMGPCCMCRNKVKVCSHGEREEE